eukprot:6207232-Pleurochrysis_carterae.AAC.2
MQSGRARAGIKAGREAQASCVRTTPGHVTAARATEDAERRVHERRQVAQEPALDRVDDLVARVGRERHEDGVGDGHVLDGRQLFLFALVVAHAVSQLDQAHGDAVPRRAHGHAHRAEEHRLRRDAREP